MSGDRGRGLPDFSADADNGVRFDPEARIGDVFVSFAGDSGSCHASVDHWNAPSRGVVQGLCRSLQREAKSIRAVEHGEPGWIRIVDAANRSANPKALACVHGMTVAQVAATVAHLVRIDWVFPLLDVEAYLAKLRRSMAERETRASA